MEDDVTVAKVCARAYSNAVLTFLKFVCHLSMFVIWGIILLYVKCIGCNLDIFLSSVIGKLCLQHEDLAKKSIPALVRELEVCEDVAVRNNVIIVMCDLCIRYTVMVDNYIPNISICLKDSDPFIRKQTLILLTNLLQVCTGVRILLFCSTIAGLRDYSVNNGKCACCVREFKDDCPRFWFNVQCSLAYLHSSLGQQCSSASAVLQREVLGDR